METRQIQTFFFKAMIEGWAVSGQKIAIPGMPGYKAIDFKDADLRLLDCYCVNSSSPMSAGTTTIWYQEDPVWVMNYAGFYVDGAIAFLKRTLHKNYKKNQFVGGRGPQVYTEDNLVYVNRFSGDFNHFRGREEVLDIDTGALLGFHEYSGMSLLKITKSRLS